MPLKSGFGAHVQLYWMIRSQIEGQRSALCSQGYPPRAAQASGRQVEPYAGGRFLEPGTPETTAGPWLSERL